MTSAHSKLPRLTESDRRRLEAWLVDFKAAWHQELLRERVRIGLLLGVIIYTSTDQGSIQVAFADPESASECVVRIDGHRIPVEELSDPIPLRAGEHELLVIQGDSVVTSRTFGVIRGKNPPLLIDWISSLPVRLLTERLRNCRWWTSQRQPTKRC